MAYKYIFFFHIVCLLLLNFMYVPLCYIFIIKRRWVYDNSNKIFFVGRGKKNHSFS